MWRSPHDTPDDPTTAAEEHLELVAQVFSGARRHVHGPGTVRVLEIEDVTPVGRDIAGS